MATVMPLRKECQPRYHIEVTLISFLVPFFFLSQFALEPMPKMCFFDINVCFSEFNFLDSQLTLASPVFVLLGIYSPWLWSLHLVEFLIKEAHYVFQTWWTACRFCHTTCALGKLSVNRSALGLEHWMPRLESRLCPLTSSEMMGRFSNLCFISSS